MGRQSRLALWRCRLVAPLTVALVLGVTAPGHAAKLFVTLSQPHGELPSGPILRYDVPGPSSGATLETTIDDPSFDNPLGIAFGPNGDMLVTNRADQFHGSISRISNPRGVPVFRAPIVSPVISGPHFPVFRGNELFVPQLGGSNVIRFLFGADGTATFNGGFATNLCCNTPRAAVVSPSDELFVSQCCLQRIQRYLIDGAGNVIPHGEIVDPRLTNPHRMVFAPWGELFVAQDPDVWGGEGGVYRFVFDADGNAVPNGLIETGPTLSLTFSPWGELFVGLIGDGTAGVSRWTFDADHTAHPNGVIATPQAAIEVAFAPRVVGPCDRPGVIHGAGGIVGTEGDDVICGSGGPDVIDGRGGNDTVYGLGGDDEISGGRGRDRIYGGAGADVVHADGDADWIDGGPGDDSIDTGNGNDYVASGPGDDLVSGGPGDDLLNAGSGDDRIHGGSGDDVLSLGAGEDRGDGGTGDDMVTGGSDPDVLRGDKGNDEIRAVDHESDRVRCGGGTDTASVDAIDDYAGCEATTVQ